MKVLGVEGGGTKTSWALLLFPDHSAGNDVRCNAVIDAGVVGPTNICLLSDEQLAMELQKLPRADDIQAVGLCLAGCSSTSDKHRVTRIASSIWPNAKTSVGSDLDSLLATAFPQPNSVGICVSAGTGTCVIARNTTGTTSSTGGKGHVLGDQGSAYWIARRALKHVVLCDQQHCDDECSKLSAVLFRELCANSKAEIASWSVTATKSDMASLCPAVFEARDRGDLVASEVVTRGTEKLAHLAAQAAKSVGILGSQVGENIISNPTAITVHITGSVFATQPLYQQEFRDKLALIMPNATVSCTLLERSSTTNSAIGAAMFALGSQTNDPLPLTKTQRSNEQGLGVIARAATEQRNVRSLHLDKMSPLEIVQTFVREEAYVQQALEKSTPAIARALELISARINAGGRMFYVGAGTSGRLGVLDASEIPPTFGESPNTFQGIIAGGLRALHRSVEDAEDSAEAGAAALRARGVSSSDVVCGIGASGRTPFVIGALREAHTLGCVTVFITCNPARDRTDFPCDVDIDLDTGPEILTGSTRLKAGTATKVCLNVLSTGAMVLGGRVESNLMVSLQATNVKLRDRAARLVAQQRNMDYDEARELLRKNEWDVVRVLKLIDH